jgi:hypothetical protein
MREYRIFLLRSECIAKPSVFLKCDTDQAAIDKAQQIAQGQEFEVWDRQRIVIRGNPPNRT